LDGIAALPGDLAVASLTLARAFSGGATMWCVAPGLEAHAHHVAVEFVHPVIMGKRALPAAVVDGPDPIGALRALGRPGDLLLAVSGASDPLVASAMRRAGAWGLTTVWIGEGPRPAPGAADFVLWVDDDPNAAWSGRYVLLYHLLWELTHVCFEHPGLLRAAPDACTDEVCVTCSDEGRLAEVVSVGPDERAQVRTPAGLEAVDTSLIGAARPGDLVLVHAGSALSLVDDGPGPAPPRDAP
jgi:hypothetical protein